MQGELSVHGAAAWWAALLVLAAATEASAALPEREWGTYVGGSAAEDVAGIAVDAEGNVYVVGGGQSTDGIATDGAHKTSPEGADAFLVKFAPDGARLWGTYIGGEDYDYAGEVAVHDGEVVIVGLSLSSTGIATPGAFQTEKIGSGCGFATVFTTAGVQTWGTYLCGPDSSASAYGVAFDPQGAVYVGGGTNTPIVGLTTPASHQPSYVGTFLEDDGYLAKFGVQGELVWGTYYGDGGDEHVIGVSINALGEIYIAGIAESSVGIASPQSHQSAKGGPGYDSFLARFDADGKRLWGTYYGGNPSESWTTVVALPQGGAALVGQTASVSGIATPGTHQAMLAGQLDDYVARFDATGKRLWGTYYGGLEKEVWDIGAATDGFGNIYVASMTASGTGIATEDAFQTVLHGSSDLVVAKFDDTGGLRWGTYYGGSNNERTLGLAVTEAGDVYLGGNTYSADGIASRGAHDISLGGVEDGFLVRFSAEPSGQPCGEPADCGGGPCVDGVCCDSECGVGAADCQVCAASMGAAADGVCTLLGANVVCRPVGGSCDVAEVCPGDAATCPDDAQVPDGDACDGGMCQAGECVPDEPVDTTSGGSTGTDPSTGSDDSGDTPTTSGPPEPTTTESVPGDSMGNGNSGSGSGATTGDDTGNTSGDTTGDATGDALGGSTAGATSGGAEGVDGCGCRGTRDASALPGLLAALLLRRRRTR